MEPVCNRCGECCYFIHEGTKYKCPYLIKEKDGLTSCEIYEKRIGTVLASATTKLYVCGYRTNQTEQIPNCPYNHLIKGGEIGQSQS